MSLFVPMLENTPYGADPNNRSGSGESYIIFGKATGWSNIDLNNLSSSDGIKIQGAALSDQSGVSVSGAGDVNNDGYDDVIIGANLADPNGRNRAGESYIIFGKNTGWSNIDLNNLIISQGIKIQGAAADDRSGYSVSGTGDVNNDGYDDIIIGAYWADPLGRLNAGESYIIFGKNTSWENIDLANLTPSQGIKIQGAVTDDRSGYSVSGAGDVNNDGYGDVIIGARLADPLGRTQAGESYIIFGKSIGWINIDLNSLTIQEGIKIYGAASGDQSGYSVSGAGDVNNDGYGDVIIGAYLADPNSRIDSGENYIIFGKATGWSNIDLNNLSFSDGIKIQGAASGDQSGFPVSGAGDANNDGYGDIIISAYTADSLGRNETGESYVIFGKNTNWQNIDLNNLTIGG